MSSSLKPITLYAHVGGPNPVKVAIVLEELGIPYDKIVVKDPKEEWFTKINPNGRLPAIIDPNNDDFTLWESGTIIEYIVETYDKENKLTSADAKEKWLLRQYLAFQISGQGPYFGQSVWFQVFHPEDVPSAKVRYAEQTERVIKVLDTILADKEYLVGGKVSYADLAFVPWNNAAVSGAAKFLPQTTEAQNLAKTYPNFTAWHDRLLARESVKKALGL